MSLRPVYGSFARPTGRNRPDLQVGFCGPQPLLLLLFFSPVERAYLCDGRLQPGSMRTCLCERGLLDANG